MRLNHVNGLLGPERYLGISSFEVGRVYVFEAMNSVLIIFFFLRSFCTYILNYVSKLGGKCAILRTA